MTKKNNQLSLKHLIQSHFDAANKIKKKILKKKKFFKPIQKNFMRKFIVMMINLMIYSNR